MPGVQRTTYRGSGTLKSARCLPFAIRERESEELI
jgi:hypothetical protein